MGSGINTAILAGGCFWGLQELFRNLNGVIKTEVGYVGGVSANPTYQNHPGHAEAVKIWFDPDQISYSQLLDFYFRIHDPTTLNRQGNDIGTSYRSVIFYENLSQKKEAKEMIDVVNKSGIYDKPIVTGLEKFQKFYPAEDFHQDYLQKNPNGYTCHYLRKTESLLG